MAPTAQQPADPRAKAATAAIFVALGVVILATFRDYGISWDEELHIPYGKMLLAYYTSGFTDREAFGFVNLFMYGGFFDLIVSVCQLVSPFGVEETRHLMGGALLLGGLAGGWRLARLLAGDRAGLIAVVCLATTPLLYGHSFINPKDAPFAWLAVWVAYYACRVFKEGPDVSRATIVGLGVSLGLALGSRLIAFALIGQMGCMLPILIWARHRNGGGFGARQIWEIARPFVAATPIALVLMAVFWPWSVQSLFNIPNAMHEFANLYWHPAMLWNGEVVQGDNLPRAYLAVLLAVQLPEYILLGFALIVASAIASARDWTQSTLSQAKTLQYLYVSLTVAVPMVTFVLLRPITYNGVRHFLFLVPQLVILAAIGLDQTITFLGRRRVALAAAFSALLCLAAGRQVWVMAELHPYQYLAFNTLTGGVAGAFGRFDLDYWGESYGEATRQLGAIVQKERASGEVPAEKLRLFVCGGNLSAGYYLTDDLEVTDDVTEADFYLAGDISNPRCSEHTIAPRPPIVEVKRGGALLSYVLDLRKPAK